MKAQEYLKTNDLFNALNELKKIIPDDKNYTKAKETIAKYEKQYKEELLKHVEYSINNKDYEKAVELLKEAIVIMQDDNDINVKLSICEKKLQQQKQEEKKKKIEELRSKQIVVVESAKIIEQDPRYKALYPDMLQAIIKNNSGKTIKKMEVGFLGYDENGYPMKIKGKYDFWGGDYEFIGLAEDVNIVAGDIFGYDAGWELSDPHGLSKIIACVKSATFYDGTTWHNQFYDLWLEEYKEKPYK